MLSRAGYSRVSGEYAVKVDPHLDPRKANVIPLDNVDTALALTRFAFVHELGPWQSVPDDVPRDLTASLAWAYDQTRPI